MSDFSYSSWAAWAQDGSFLGDSCFGNDDGTIVDGDNDNQFEGSDAGGLEPRSSLDNITYVGTIDFNGTVYPVFQDDWNFDYWIFAQSDNELPSTDFNPADINTGAVFEFCFAAGTLIATPVGEIAVEALKIGDMVSTPDGKVVPVKWIGKQTVFTMFRPPERLALVRISANALGDGQPHSDLTVTADHGIFVQGVICHAGALVNGTTIARAPITEQYTVYHIETEDHEIILANGAPAETFIDNASRRAFDNFAEFETLYGDVPEMEELPYPRAMSARQVPGAIRARLAGKDAA